MNNYLYIVDRSLHALAEQLSQFTQDILIVETIPPVPVYLLLDNNGLALINDEFKPLYVKDIYSGLWKRTRNPTNELLIQAIKLKSGPDTLIFDLTAGLGKDAALIAGSGYQLIMVEKNPILATILYYALLNSYLPNDKLRLVYQDAVDFLQNYSGQRPDVIYLDPMFKEQKLAKAKKEMQLIQALAGKDELNDNTDLLVNLSFKVASKKLIVKRDNKQAPIIQVPLVSYVKPGKTIRYDIYLL